MNARRALELLSCLVALVLAASSAAHGHLSNEQEQEHPDETNQQHQHQPPSNLQVAQALQQVVAQHHETEHQQHQQPQQQQQQLHQHNEQLEHHTFESSTQQSNNFQTQQEAYLVNNQMHAQVATSQQPAQHSADPFHDVTSALEPQRMKATNQQQQQQPKVQMQPMEEQRVLVATQQPVVAQDQIQSQQPQQQQQLQQPQQQQLQQPQQQQQQLQQAPTLVQVMRQQAAPVQQSTFQPPYQQAPIRRPQVQKQLASSATPQQQQQQQQQQPMLMTQPYQNVMQQQQQQVASAPVQPQMVQTQMVQPQMMQQQQQPQPMSSFKQYQASIVSPLYLGHNPFIEILRPLSYADDNIVTLNLSHSHIYEIDGDAFVGQRFEHIDLSNNKLGLIHSRSFRIGPIHSRHTPFEPARQQQSAGSGNQAGGHSSGAQMNQAAAAAQSGNSSSTSSSSSSSSQAAANNKYQQQQQYATRRPPPAHPKSVTIDFSHNPAIVALSGAFDHIDVPNCLLNFTNSTVELKFGAFKKYFKEHPGHLIDIESVDCCDQEWLLGYKHNFVARTRCAHDPNLYLLKVSQQTIIDSCIAYVTSARHSMTMPSSGIIHSAAANGPRHPTGSHGDSQQYLTYLILGGTAMILTSLSIYIIFYMFSLKAAFVYQMQTQKN